MHTFFHANLSNQIKFLNMYNLEQNKLKFYMNIFISKWNVKMTLCKIYVNCETLTMDD